MFGSVNAKHKEEILRARRSHGAPAQADSRSPSENLRHLEIYGVKSRQDLPLQFQQDPSVGAVKCLFIPGGQIFPLLAASEGECGCVSDLEQSSFRASNVAGLRKHIRVGQRAGFIDPELLPAETAGWLTWMAERGMTQLVQHAGKAKLRRLEETFTSILWYALYEGQGRAST